MWQSQEQTGGCQPGKVRISKVQGWAQAYFSWARTQDKGLTLNAASTHPKGDFS